MKRSIASFFFSSAWAFATITRMVWPRTSADDALGRRALRRKGDGVAVGILERFDRRGRLGVPVVRGAGGLGADDAHRRALGKGRHGALGADREAHIGAAGDHRLQRFARARRVDDVELDAVLLEDARLLAEI